MIHPVALKLFPRVRYPNYPLAGRLRFFVKNWEKLTADPVILKIVTGWEIPFMENPQQGKFRRFQSNKSQNDLITEEVESMLEKGAIRLVHYTPGQVLSNIFLREKKEGTFRPIIDLKRVNEYIPYVKFKMETLKNIRDLLKKGDLMVKIDLKDAYFTVPLSQNSLKYVRFSWQGSLYEFLCMMFGLGPAPRIFTKIMKVPMSLLRRLKIRIVIYMDDMLLMGAGWTEIIQARDTTIHVLESLGFIINYKKSVLDPSTQIEFLGVMVDSMEMTLSIPQSKMQKLISLCQKTLAQPTMSMRKLAKVLGTLKATAPGFSWAPLQTRYLQQILVQGTKQGLSYEAMVTLSEEATWELKWWLDNMKLLNGKSLSVNPPDLFISTDAAKGKRGGWGAECHGTRTGGPWKTAEKSLHINVLELIAAELGLKTFTKGMFGISVHLKMDNTTALSNVVKMGGTKNLDMIHISKRLWTYLLDNKIELTVEYIPSKLNVEADWESRNWVDSSEWMLNPQVFQQICHRWGYPTWICLLPEFLISYRTT